MKYFSQDCNWWIKTFWVWKHFDEDSRVCITNVYSSSDLPCCEWLAFTKIFLDSFVLACHVWIQLTIGSCLHIFHCDDRDYWVSTKSLLEKSWLHSVPTAGLGISLFLAYHWVMVIWYAMNKLAVKNTVCLCNIHSCYLLPTYVNLAI